MAGQNMKIFLTRNSNVFHNDVKTTRTTTSPFNHFSLQKFLLTLLLLQSCLFHCTAASPIVSPSEPNLTTSVQDDSRPNNYVDIAKINKNLGLFQGDIKLSRYQQSIYEIITTRKFYPQSRLPEKMVQYWQHGFIYYDTSSISDPRLLSLIELAISTLNRETNCLIFHPAGRSSTDYIKFTEGSGCWSYLGKQGGPQEIALGADSCRYRNVIIHLLFHAIGLVHEESRPDRDLNVKVVEENLAPGKETNFDILPEEIVRSNGTNYNYCSIMHSHKRTSSRLTSNGYRDTIRPIGVLSCGKNFGSIDSLTPGDITRVKALYCPFDLTQNSWTEWSVWSTCSVTCNSGVKHRTRICRKPDSSHVCAGSNFQLARCHKYACAVRSNWGKWGEWSQCSASCGEGRQVRVRECVGGDVCTKGKGRQYRSCNKYRCPGSRWNSWSQWAPCSQSCHYGKTTRTRSCSGNDCTGLSTQTKLCNYKIPCSPVWGQWSNWTRCTEEKVMRTRSCRLPPYKCRGPHTEYLNCKTNGSKINIPLTTNGHLVTTEAWTTWSPCNSPCGPGEQERSNDCGALGECRQMLQIIILLGFLYLFPCILPNLLQI